MTLAIETQSLSRHYRPPQGPPIAAIDRVSLSVSEGWTLGLLGPRGAGKTTLLRLLGARLRPTGGAVYLRGLDIRREPRRAARSVGMLDEALAALSNHAHVWQTLLHYGRANSLLAHRRHVAAEELLQRLGLWDRRSEPLTLLAEAERRLLALACLRLAGFNILLLDEPTDDLSLTDSARLVRGVRAISDSITVVLATRQLSVARALAERVAVLAGGRLLADLPREALPERVQPERYEIRVAGHLNPAWCDWLDGFSVINTEDGEAVLSGPIPDQAALHGLLARLQSMNIPVRGFSRCEPGLTDILARLHTGQP